MSLYKRGSIWWSSFSINGRRIQASTGCSDRKKAAEWEKQKITAVAEEKYTRIALEKIKIAFVNQNLSMPQAWDTFLHYPRARQPKPPLIRQYQAVFDDFHAFIGDDCTVSAITETMAQNYISHIRTHGRFSGFSYLRGGKQIAVSRTTTALSPRTVNFYIGTLKLIFQILTQQKFCLENPFAHIEKMRQAPVSREIFNEQEIATLLAQTQHPLYPLIILGFYTGLRRGDIVRLSQAQLDWNNHFIRLDQHKTRHAVAIPMLPPVIRFLSPRRHLPGPLFPELLDAYQNQNEKLSSDFKSLLQSIGIADTTVAVPGRARKQSVKDVHSLRHTFAYVAGKYGVPFHVVQSILGHMTPAMTRHYMAHANDADKRAAMALFPVLSPGRDPRNPRNLARRLQKLLARITPDNLDTARRRINKILGGIQ